MALNKTVYLGNQTVFTIVVTNTGDCDLGDVCVVESVPAGLKFSGFVGDAWSTSDNVTFKYAGVLKVNESVSFDIVFDTLAAGNWTNGVTVTSNVTENRTANNNTIVKGPDLKVEKLTLNKIVYLGNQTVFTIVVTNTGDCDLGDVCVVESVPAGLKFSGFVGDAWSTSDNVTFKYAGVLKVNESVSFDIVFDTLAAGNWTNGVTVTSNVTENRTANNNTIVKGPDLKVEKLTLNKIVYLGNQTVFTIVVTNTGDCDLGDVCIVENIPEGLKYNTYEGKNWKKVGDYKFIYGGVLKVNESVSINIVFDTLAAGNWTNVVTATSNVTENKTANNNTTVYAPNMSVVKLANDNFVYNGNQTSFTIIVKNTGDCRLENIYLDEMYPEGLVYDRFIGDKWSKIGNRFIYNGILDVDAEIELTIIFKTTKSGNFTNIVTASSNLVKNKTANNTTTVYTPSLKVEKITLTDIVYVGNQTSFAIIVTNTGDCTLGNVFVLESSYHGLVFDRYYGDGWIKQGDKFIYSNDLKAGESAGFIVVFNTTKTGNFTNIVIAGSNLTDNKTALNKTEVIMENHTENKTSNDTVDNATKDVIKQNIGLATGNPLLMLLIALFVCAVPFRKQKK